MNKVLVTGAAGFTGRYLLNHLEETGHDIIVPGYRDEAGIPAGKFDLTNGEVVERLVANTRPTHVVHLAALSYVGHADQEAFYRVNVLGTTRLLSALSKLDEPPEKVIVASSANVYGTPPVPVIDESICPVPVNHYACSKLAMEYMARTWRDRMPLIITRPFNYTGPGQDERFLIPKIVGHFRRGERVIELGNIDVSRDFSDVRDVVRAYTMLLQSDIDSETVNICSGKATALHEIIQMAGAQCGYDIEVKTNPDFVRANEIPTLCGSADKLKQLTGWRPKYDLRETLEAMLAIERARL